MPLATSKDVLTKAYAEGYAVGAFNLNNMEMAQAIVQAAEEENSPVIIQASQGAIKYAGLEMITAMAKVLADHASSPIVLHLDHGTDYVQNVKCLRAGFTSLMFDGHALPIDENIKMTAKIVDIAHSVGLPVEAEIGSVLTIEKLLSDAEMAEIRAMEIPQQFEILRKKIGPKVDENIAKPEDAKRFVDETGVDFVAAAVGSVHGLWLDIWPLRIDRLKEINDAVKIPIVGHGTSGVLMTRKEAEDRGVELLPGEGSLQDAIKYGYTKINIATALGMEFNKAMLAAAAKRPGEKDPRKLLGPGRDAIVEKVKGYMRFLGSSGKAAATSTGKSGALGGGTVARGEE
ncbi:MAG TPA: class II fructose-bisphosphate aldolase [Armatimonadota bacterium]|nr:class II fructose-bisphosphate aldolase [Armatimonadota bacterium]